MAYAVHPWFHGWITCMLVCAGAHTQPRLCQMFLRIMLHNVRLLMLNILLNIDRETSIKVHAIPTWFQSNSTKMWKTSLWKISRKILNLYDFSKKNCSSTPENQEMFAFYPCKLFSFHKSLGVQFHPQKWFWLCFSMPFQRWRKRSGWMPF